MTAQPRGHPGSGIHPSPPQVIPGNRFQQGSSLNYNQHSFSPRHFTPSSPLQRHYYPQPDVATGAHDMNKNQGVSGTPPNMVMMMEDGGCSRDNMSLHYYPNPAFFWQSHCSSLRGPPPTVVQHQPYYHHQNGHRPRAPMPPNNQQYFYQQPVQRFAGQSPAPPPPTSPSYFPGPNVSNQFQYVGPHIQQPQSMYSPAYGTPQQYTQPPPPQQPLMAATMPAHPGMHQPPQSSQKPKKNIITIKDPTTNQDVTNEIMSQARQDSLSTPPSGRSSATPPQNSDISAQFTAQVMAAAYGGKQQGVSPLVSKPPESVAVMMPQNPQMAQQMLGPEGQIVGSPNLGAGLVTPPPTTYMHVPPSSSPRPQIMHNVGMPPQLSQPYGMSPVPTSHVAAQMLSSSPSRMPTVHPANVNIPHYQTQMQDHALPPQGYQLPPISTPQSQPQQQYMVNPPDPNLVQRPRVVAPVPQGMQYPVRLQQPPPVPPPEAAMPQASQVVVSQAPPQPVEATQNSVTIARPMVPQDVSPPKQEEAIQSDQRQPDVTAAEPVAAEEPVVKKEGEDKTAAVEAEVPAQPVQDNPPVEPAVESADAEKSAPVAPEPEESQVTGPDSGAQQAPQAEIETPAARGQEPVPIDDSKDNVKPASPQPAVAAPEPREEVVKSDIPPEKPPVEPIAVESSETKAQEVSQGVVADTPKPDEKTMPETPKKVTPAVHIVPATPVSNPQKDLDADAPMPSAKSDVEGPKPETETSAIGDVKKAGEPSPKQPAASPDLKDKKQVQEGVADSVVSKEAPAPVPTQGKSKPQEGAAVIVNGTATGASPDSEAEPKDKKAARKTSVTTPRASKTAESTKKEQAVDVTPATKSSAEKPTPKSDKTNGVPDKPKPSVPELKYGEDQWSPLNPDGKRKYDSSFLLQFQYKPTSLEKPKDLPNIDIVLDQPHNQKANPMQPLHYSGGGADFTPPYMRPRGVMPGGGKQTSSGSRPPRRPIGKCPPKVVSIDRTEVELKRTANAWKPVKLDARGDKSADEIETMEILREVRAILNKLTPSKFTELMRQVLDLKIDTEAKLRGAIDLIFEKAIDEPNFSETYANMCRNMTTLRVTADPPSGTEPAPGPPQPVEFRKLLLTRCQREFEKNKSDQEHLQELKIKMEQNTDQSLAAQLKEEYEYAESKERRRNLGNIRFIGELFKLQMLTESIMHNCIMSLFKARDDDHLESLCRLLTTIGKDLDHAKGKSRMDQYFDQIQKIVREKKTSSRVRFMLQDVFDLRLNSWVPRAVTVQGPKTISQIHQDAKEEQEQLQLSMSTAPPIPPVKPGNRQANRMGSRGHGGEEGWTKVPTTQKPTRYDPSKMKLKTNTFDEGKVKLGPSSAFGGWKSGSGSTKISRTGSAGYSPSSSMDRTGETVRSNTPTSMMNRFSALSQSQAQGAEYEYQKRQGGRQSSREGTRTGSRGSASSSGGRTPRKDERQMLLETARKMTSADRSGGDSRQRSSRDSSPSVNLRPSAPPAAPVHKYNADLDEDKMETKSKNIFTEFLFLVDFKEATECIEELNASPTLMHVLVYAAHEFTLEKTKKERRNIGRLMVHLLKLGRISVQHYIKGVGKLLECATDYELDVPKVWEYFADQICPVFEDESSEVSFSCLAELCAPLLEEKKSGVFVSSLFKSLSESMPMATIHAKCLASNVRWNDVLGTNDPKSIADFLSQNGLTEPQGEGKKAEPSSKFPAEPAWSAGEKSAEERSRLERALSALLNSNKSNDVIFDWVEENVTANDRVKPMFLRALTTSICQNAISETMTVNKEKITGRSIVLRKFLESDSDRELQALYALQELMVFLEQPPNVLRTLFDVLYDEDVISENSFYNWEKSTDSNEQEGRGVALAAANPFFTWLRQAEPESD